MVVTTLKSDPGMRALACGAWHIAMTDMPAWRRRAGMVTYMDLPGGEVADVVTWQEGDRAGHIAGIDRPIDEDGWQWEWRGVGPLTFLVRSRWRFLSGNLQQGWAVAEFEKTLFTPAGFDIYCRSPRPPHGHLSAALASLPEEVARRLYIPPLWIERRPAVEVPLLGANRMRAPGPQ